MLRQIIEYIIILFLMMRDNFTQKFMITPALHVKKKIFKIWAVKERRKQASRYSINIKIHT